MSFLASLSRVRSEMHCSVSCLQYSGIRKLLPNTEDVPDGLCSTSEPDPFVGDNGESGESGKYLLTEVSRVTIL